MTLEEELALIHKKPAPGTVAEAVPDQAIPAVGPAAKTPEQIDAELGLEPAETGIAPLPKDATTWDIMGASWTATTIKGDEWGYYMRKRKELAHEMYDNLTAESRVNVQRKVADPTVNSGTTGFVEFEDMVIGEVNREMATQPDGGSRWAAYPTSADDFTTRINKERRADLDEAQAVLDQPGGGIPEFIGAAARDLTGPVNLLTAPLGGVGSGWKFLAGEFAAGAFSSALELPGEMQTARDMDIPAPDPWTNILIGGAAQAGFAGLLAAVPKVYRKFVGRELASKDSIAAVTPDGGDKLGSEIEVDRAEAKLRGEQTAQAAISPQIGPLAGAENLPYNEGAVLRSIVGAESGGVATARNPNSSARGVGQFIKSTWFATLRAHRPDLMQGKTDAEIWALADDAKLNGEMLAMFTRDNAAYLQANGVAVDPGAQYLAHFMGAGGAVRAMKTALDTPISDLMSPKAIAANASIRYGEKRFADFTAGDLRSWAAYKMRAAYDPNASRDLPIYSETSRGYTGEGQVAAGDGTKIDVDYVVVDIDSLTRASGDLQPRDRSRGTSDAWIADTAARLDPAQLMPSPVAHQGAPIVGPDSVIESGNGRIGAIARAYEYHPDRASAYRAQIEAAGYEVPEGVKRPVLVARRKTELTPDQRRQFVIDAQDSGVAVMTPTEIARASSRAMTAPVLGRLDPSQALTAEANGDFVRAALAGLPRSARNAMFDAGGMLNASGQRQLREAVFARAWNDPDIIEMFAEADHGELKSLMEALATAAPNWAALKADIEAGLVRPEMDISGHVLDAMRLIASARKLASREGLSIGKALSELLDDVDLIQGAVAPLTSALVRKFWKNGRAASADDVSGFLGRYAEDARKAGSTGDMLGAASPRDVLRAIDKDAFADLPEDVGPVRGFARRGQQTPPNEGYDTGASSPEAEAEDVAVRDALEALQDMVADAPRTIVRASDLAPGEFRKLDAGLKKAQPFETAEEVFAAGAKNHAALNDAAGTAAQDLGLTFKPAPVKKLDRIVQKVEAKYRGNYRKIADVARTGITVNTIDQAEAFVAAMGKKFHLVDEGWAVTPEGYFDRKLMVRFDDGQLGEIQIWPPGMLEAKSKGGGHKLYEISRDLSQPQAAREKANADMAKLYAAVRDALDPSFAEKLGIAAPRSASAADASASVSSNARSSDSTSSAISREPSTGSQTPSSVSNLAKPSSDTAASSDTSNSNSLMGKVPPSGQDTRSVASAAGEVNTQADLAGARADLADEMDALEIEMPDGTTATFREILDDLDADDALVRAIDACSISTRGD